MFHLYIFCFIPREKYKIKAGISQNIPANLPPNAAQQAPETAVLSYRDAFYRHFLFTKCLFGGEGDQNAVQVE